MNVHDRQPSIYKLIMGEPIQCQVCDQAATVHLTQIANNKIHKIHLCEDCAEAKGMTDPDVFSLEDLFSPSSGQKLETISLQKSITCKRCGLSSNDFKRHGRLGCPDCYDYLKPLIEPMLVNMHKSISHQGKIPRRSLDHINLNKQLRKLEEELDTAVKEERYEDAALCRDKIKNVKKTSKTAVEIGEK